MTSALLCIVACSLLTGGLAKKQPSSPITNGFLMPPAHAPFVVSIQEGDQSICGGAIVSPFYVLTAAHCLDNLSRYARVYAGDVDLEQQEESSQIRYIQRIIPHPQYDFYRRDSDHDIGLIEVTEPFVYDYLNVGPVALSVELPAAGQEARAIGWGKLYENDRTPRKSLRGVDLIVASDKTCSLELDKASSTVIVFEDFEFGDLFGGLGSSFFGGFGRRRLLQESAPFMGPPPKRPLVSASSKNLICADGLGRTQGVCSGDSGGPLYTDDGRGNFALIGVVSFSLDKCEGVAAYDFFTAVSPYLQWINSTVTAASKKPKAATSNNPSSSSKGTEEASYERDGSSFGFSSDSFGSFFSGSRLGDLLDQLFGRDYDSDDNYASKDEDSGEEVSSFQDSVSDSYTYVDENGVMWEVISVPVSSMWG